MINWETYDNKDYFKTKQELETQLRIAKYDENNEQKAKELRQLERASMRV